MTNSHLSSFIPRVRDTDGIPLNYSIVGSLPRRRPHSMIYRSTKLPLYVWDGEVPKPQYQQIPQAANPLIPLSYEEASLLPENYSQYISGYTFCDVADPVAVRKELLEGLSTIDAIGRIYINVDGTNIQMACHPKHTPTATDIIRSVGNGVFSNMRLFSNEIIDVSQSAPLFDKLNIKVRTLLNDGLPKDYSNQLNEYMENFDHLSPADWHERMKNADEDAIILDMRNTYEYEVGTFKNALPVDVPAYRDTFPELDRLLGREEAEDYSVVNKLKVQHANGSFDTPLIPSPNKPAKKDQQIMIFCTGGIRCMKVGAYLSTKGYTNVATLEGGINAYIQYALKTFPNPRDESLFEGVNVVFDDRRAVRVTDHEFGECSHCGVNTSRHRNCSCYMCDILFLQCETCEDVYNGCCSIKCNDTEFGRGDQVRQNIKSFNDNLHQLKTNQDKHVHKESCSDTSCKCKPISLVPVPPGPSFLRPRINPLDISNRSHHCA